MKLEFLLNLLLLGALILAQDEMEGMEDSEEMEDEEEDGAMMNMMSMDQHGPPGSKNDTMKEMDRKKKNKGIKDIYLAMMLVKSLIGTMLSFVSPVMQVKGFGLSVINTLVNVARFVLDMRRMMPMIKNVMAGWARWDKPTPSVIPTMPANRKTIRLPDPNSPYKFYMPQFNPDRSGYPPYVRPLTSVYLPATTYAPHRSPFRHYYTRYNKELTTPSSQWSQLDDSNNFLRKSFDIGTQSPSSLLPSPGSTIDSSSINMIRR